VFFEHIKKTTRCNLMLVSRCRVFSITTTWTRSTRVWNIVKWYIITHNLGAKCMKNLSALFSYITTNGELQPPIKCGYAKPFWICLRKFIFLARCSLSIAFGILNILNIWIFYSSRRQVNVTHTHTHRKSFKLIFRKHYLNLFNSCIRKILYQLQYCII